MMLALGMFLFEVGTAAYQKLQRASQQRWAASNRLGQRAVQQYLGKGEETLTLSGTLLPEVTGGHSNLDALEQMAAEGKSWALVAGNGAVLGQWIIKSVSETQSVFMPDGTARKIEFSLSLIRIDDDRTDAQGNINPYIKRLLQ